MFPTRTLQRSQRSKVWFHKRIWTLVTKAVSPVRQTPGSARSQRGCLAVPEESPRPPGPLSDGMGSPGPSRVGHREEMCRGATTDGGGRAVRASLANAQAPDCSLPSLERRLQLSHRAGRRLGRARFPNFVGPAAAGPAPQLGAGPGPTARQAAARTHPPHPGTARVYLRPRSRRSLRRPRPHRRKLGFRHSAAKFPNMDSPVRSECLGAQRSRPGWSRRPTGSRGKLRCSAPLAPPRLPFPRLVRPPPRRPPSARHPLSARSAAPPQVGALR